MIFCLLITGTADAQPLRKGLRAITQEWIGQHIGFLASDSLKGRDTPSPGLDLAASYIAGELASLGIQKINNSYFQEVPLYTRNLEAEKCRFVITRKGETRSFSLKADYTPFEMTADTLVQGALVFAGYGITAPEFGYDDYRDLDVRGKIVLVMKHEPGEKDTASPFSGLAETIHSLLKTKMANAAMHGAAGLLVVTDPLNHLMLTPQGYPWPGLSKFLPQDNLPVEMYEKQEHLPFVQVGESVVQFLLGSVDSLKAIQRKIDASLSPRSFDFENADGTLETGLKVNFLSAHNVAGCIEGRHPRLKNEYVIAGAHYDHVGSLKKYREGDDFIFNGADDNASGTAGVMALARAFASAGRRPDRSVLFLFFAGEEKGLYGSKHYCINPLVPLENSVVMLNLDMISRNGEDTLMISGIRQNPGLVPVLLKQAHKTGLKNFPEKEQFFSRSDHYNFYRKGISAVNVSSGLHDDYHTVRDGPASVNPRKAAKIAEMTFRTAWKIANSKIRPETETPGESRGLSL